MRAIADLVLARLAHGGALCVFDLGGGGVADMQALAWVNHCLLAGTLASKASHVMPWDALLMGINFALDRQRWSWRGRRCLAELGMRKNLIGTLFALFLLWPMALLAQSLQAIPPLDTPVVDTTATLDAQQKQQLEQQALALQQRKGSQLQVLLVSTTQPESIEQYTQRVFDQWQVGRKGVDDGVLLVVAKDDRRVRIQPGYGLEGVIPDAIANRIIQEYLAPHFRQGDYAGGIQEASSTLVQLIDGEELPAPVSGHAGQRQRDTGSGWIVALFVGFVVANIARGIFSAAPRPLRAVLSAVAAGGAALLLTSLFLASGLAALLGLVLGLMSGSPGRFVHHGGWGGGGFGGGGFGGGGGGGWGGGGGMSGGGGASGSW